MKLSRRGLFAAIVAILVFASFEFEGYAFGALSIAEGNSFSFYKNDVFDLTKQQLEAENTSGPLGWPRTDDARPQPREQPFICGSAFGDSFTHADEVNDGEAWPFLLSELLGCKVQNFGVGGYGLDQSMLRYERVAPAGRVVIIGLFIEMIRRDLAASWTFYAGPTHDNLPTYAITKPMFLMDGDDLRLIPRPTAPVTRAAIEQHHKHDFFRNMFWTPLAFPYTYAAARAIVRRPLQGQYNASSNQYWQKEHPSGAAALALKMLARLRAQAEQRNQRLAVVMIPQVEEAVDVEPAYAAFMQDLARQEPELCIIDTHPAMRAAEPSLGVAGLRAPHGHYTAAGNKILAATTLAGLQRCRIGVDELLGGGDQAPDGASTTTDLR